jgi:CRISPR system Cascade subunit CasC
MTTFIQIHTLQTFAACNLNRGDDGRPKTLVYGGVERLRYSSQALKYALRNSPVLRTTLGEVFGTRTKMLGHDVHDHLVKMKVSPAKAAEIGAQVTEVCGKIDEKQSDGLKATTLYFVGPDEKKALYVLAESAAKGKEVDWNPKQILKGVTTAVDIAMFGRMYTDDATAAPRGAKKGKSKKSKAAEADTEDGEEADDNDASAKFKRRHANIEAAVHVAHSFTTHRSSPEDDYFSASDDLAGPEVSEASHIDTQFFGSGVFYSYVTVNRDRLVQNLNNNVELANHCIEALVRVLPSTSPSGKRASFASHGKSQFALVEIGTQQPRSLAAAFCEPVRSVEGYGLDRASAERLLKQRAAFETVYGKAADRHAMFQAFPGHVEGSLEQVIQALKG